MPEDDPVPKPLFGGSGGYPPELKNDPYKLRKISQNRIERLTAKVREENERSRKTLQHAAGIVSQAQTIEAAKSKSTARDEVREFLEECVKTRRGKVAKTRLLHICESLFRTACDPRSPGQVHAARALLDRGFGPPAPADDSPAMRKGGLTVVYVDRSALDAEIPVVDESHLQQKQLSAPEFIDEESPDGN